MKPSYNFSESDHHVFEQHDVSEIVTNQGIYVTNLILIFLH